MKIRSMNFSLMLLTILSLFSFTLNAQVKGISGVVFSEGEALLGATVVIKGTSEGSITGLDGDFSVQAKEGDMLVVSFIGFITKEVLATDGMKIELEPDSKLLDDVVVIGYGSVKKSDLTGSVSSVKMETVPMKPSNSIDGLLQGQSAGVNVINSSDDPGASSTIRIRGASSLNGDKDPIVIVDGIPMGSAGDLKQISPSDIASVEILKDAASTAIYGSRGANGVIIVTTKKGTKGKTEISVSQQTTVSQFTSELNLWRDMTLMASLSNESRTNGGFTPLYIGATDANGTYYPSIKEIEDGSWGYYTAWDDVVFRTPISNNSTVSVRRNTEKTAFSLSANHYTDKGVYNEDDYSKTNLNLNVKQELSEKIDVAANVIVSEGKRNNNGGLAYWRNPLFPEYDENDDYYLINNKDYSHPTALTENKLNQSEFMDIISSGIINAQVLPSLKLTSQVSYVYGKSVTDWYNPKIYTEDGVNNNGAGGINNWDKNKITAETFLTFAKDIDKHSFSAMGGFSYEYTEINETQLKAYDFVNESLQNGNLASGNPEQQSVSNGVTEEVLHSWLGRVNYTYDNTYLAALTMRADGSSKFGENNRWAMFPSAALGWKMHNEDFIRNLGVFDELKVRGSVGISGNQGIPPYLVNSQYGQSQYYSEGGWETGIGPGYVVDVNERGEKTWGGIPNPDLKWETTRQYNIGVDLAFFNRRLRVTADHYNKYTYDLLRERNLAPTSGYDKMWVNDGELSNKGFEISFAGDIVDQKDWGLTGNLIISKNKNEIVSLGNSSSNGLSTDPNTGMHFEYYGVYLDDNKAYPGIIAEGEAVGVFYGYQVDGIIQTEGEGLAAGLTGDMAQPGEFKYVDINEDGVVDANDRTIIGDPNPDFTASLTLTARYKRFDFSMLFNSSFGQDIYNTQAFNQANNQPLRWTPDNPTNDYPSLREGRSVMISDWYVQDGSYLRLQNMSLGYNFNTDKIDFLDRGRITMNASNLFTLTNFEGYDPEVGTDGIYYGGYPKLRKWSIGLDFTF